MKDIQSDLEHIKLTKADEYLESYRVTLIRGDVNIGLLLLRDGETYEYFQSMVWYVREDELWEIYLVLETLNFRLGDGTQIK